MKIAQVCPRFYPDIGGVETHVYEISKRLTKNFEVEVLTTDPMGKYPEVEEIDGITVRRFKSIAPSEAYYFSLEMYRFLKERSSDYDIIHAHNYHAFPALFVALTKSNNKLVFTPHYHGRGHSFIRDLLHKPYKIFGRWIFEKSDAVICVSNFEKELILKNFNVNSSKLFVIPNGINLEEFKDVEKIKKRKDRTVRTILYVGRIEKYKGLDYVVKALKYLPENYVLEIVGKGSYKSKIVKLAKNLGVINRIRFYQDLSREELIERYAKADVFVLLSKYEAYGLVVAEALACKTPCIVANTSALSEWIDNRNVFGIDYPIHIEKLVNLIKEMSGVSVEGVNIPTWDVAVEKLKRVYRGV
ncbi:glycosyltransferase family 4 protein [Archaeoglobus profundus]|uniref:Glycosyl transferase group 1 n=1 Tax=Archaeoglobus profundus (strain DSM 5631 / JCM 9629 / NBRC 100127 / Av18) TaxID=572546 RepID=D2RH06_ARCPA|nr:glycosyltransferase family 4 protein [Archaeoglobus profundus]ADB57581.1 glycosyl transferase group 1 [Archaeoglobus profundus DSM 5631]